MKLLFLDDLHSHENDDIWNLWENVNLWKMLKIQYKTNQGTSAHTIKNQRIKTQQNQSTKGDQRKLS